MHHYRARYVFPVVGEPIGDGVLSVDGERIVAVGKRPPGGQIEDLGNVAMVPGLVNAHTHLEFSDLRKPLGTPGMALVDWIRLVIDHFRRPSRRSLSAVRRGLEESFRLGTTMLGEIAQADWPRELFEHAQLDATVFLELIAPTADRVGPLLPAALQHAANDSASGRWRPGLCPHSPYSLVPQVFDAAVSLSVEHRVPLAFHLAESREELQLLQSGSGPFRDYFEGLGNCDAELFDAGRRPLDYLRRLARAERAMVIHGNYLDDEEIAFLADHAEHMAVVYCPRTHAYFRHDPYPLQQMIAAGVRMAVGTDSRASSPDLSVLAELRTIATNHPTLDRDVVLELGTLGGAIALGRGRQVGSLEVGKAANFTLIALPQHDADPYAMLFDCNLPVTGTCYRGHMIPHETV